MKTLRSGDINKISMMLWVSRRHFWFTLKHITLRKLLNSFVCLFEMFTRRSKLYSHPLHLRVEVCSYCNLRCQGCLLGGMNYSESAPNHRNERLMSYELFKNVVKDFLPYIYKLSLFDEGEPLLNKDIYKMINYLSINNVCTCVSSNFSMELSDETLKTMVTCRLEHLVISIDGSTQERYSQYRIGGDLNLVIKNIKRLIMIKEQHPPRSLKVELQFIDFDNNKQEREAMHNLSKTLGVSSFTILQGCKRDKEMKFTGRPEDRRKRGCYEAWITAVINSRGELGVCDFGEDNGIPNIGLATDYRLKKLRNHPIPISLRGSFRNALLPLNNVCASCTRYLR